LSYDDDDDDDDNDDNNNNANVIIISVVEVCTGLNFKAQPGSVCLIFGPACLSTVLLGPARQGIDVWASLGPFTVGFKTRAHTQN